MKMIKFKLIFLLTKILERIEIDSFINICFEINRDNRLKKKILSAYQSYKLHKEGYSFDLYENEYDTVLNEFLYSGLYSYVEKINMLKELNNELKHEHYWNEFKIIVQKKIISQ